MTKADLEKDMYAIMPEYTDLSDHVKGEGDNGKYFRVEAQFILQMTYTFAASIFENV